jgi:hypothetical protein
MAERVGDLTVALAPESIRRRLERLCARVHCPLPKGVDVIGLEVEDGRRAPDGERREDAHLGELVREHHGCVAEPKLDLHQLVARYLDPTLFLGAKHVAVPLGRPGGVADNDVSSDRVHFVRQGITSGWASSGRWSVSFRTGAPKK